MKEGSSVRARSGEPALPTRRGGAHQRQHGQAIVLVGLMMMAMLAGAGLAIDAQLSFFYASAAERAASAGALSGVVFMPYSFTSGQATPPGSGNDATDRALAEVARNGFTNGVNATVTVSNVPGFTNRLRVTVSTSVPTVFMVLFGIGSTSVTQSATSEYLPPIDLGQPGQQLGSTVSELGTSGYYFMRMEGWSVDRGHGDAYTPNPSCPYASCPSTDVHQISGAMGTDNIDSSLPPRGGYNFKIVVPPGSAAQIQVYNAAFAPDDGAGGPNYCENWQPGTAGHQCSAGGSYGYHEYDSWPGYTNVADYTTMEYTVFKVVNDFVRNTDVELTQMKVRPIDARNWNQTPSSYVDMVTGNTITQTYGAGGAPTNMQIYHSWIDTMSYAEPAPNAGMVQLQNMPGWVGGGVVGPGEYRLRVDSLNADGTNPPGSSQAHKGFAVRAALGNGAGVCASCTVTAIRDMAIYTPFHTTNGGSFQLPIFQLPPDYAGQTIAIDIYDPGDISGGGSLYMGIIDPSTSSLFNVPGNVSIYNLWQQRSNCCGAAATLVAVQPQAEILAASSAGLPFDNYWLHYSLPIPSTYNPGPDPNNWWVKLQYRTTQSVTASDTITITLSLLGSPAHLLG